MKVLSRKEFGNEKRNRRMQIRGCLVRGEERQENPFRKLLFRTTFTVTAAGIDFRCDPSSFAFLTLFFMIFRKQDFPAVILYLEQKGNIKN